jgi:glycosyltransferase involved in cell wall biosynthesis
MRILHCVRSLDPARGGPIESIRQSEAALRELGVDSEIASLDVVDAPWGRESAFPVHLLGKTGGSFGWGAGFVEWLRKNRGRFDAVIAHNLWTFSCLGVWAALRRTDTPYYVYVHGLLDPEFKKLYPVKHFKKMLYWRLVQWRVMRDAAGVLFTGERECELARTAFRPFQMRPCIVPYCVNGPDQDIEACKHAFELRFPELSGRRIVLFLGRVHPKKGLDLLINAFAANASRWPDVLLAVAGPQSESYGKELRQLAAALGIESRIRWLGMLQGAEKWGAFASAEVFALTTHQENFGIAIVEALSCGTPVLITDKVNICDEIRDSGAGFVEADTADGAVRLLEGWFSLTMAERDRMSADALRCFGTQFDSRVAAQRLLECISAEQR